jgi:hypothetical protein
MISMKYTVCAFKMIDTAGGLIEDMAPAIQQTVRTSTAAEKLAEQWTNEEQYSSIYIHYNHKDSDCYYNPVVGFEPVGKDWITHLGK